VSEDTITSAICDSSLLEKGRWENKCRLALLEWIKTADFQEKRLKASRLIPFLILHFLGDRISEEGKVRGPRLEESLVHLEDLIIATRSGIGRKFYRDHLNHLIRVALLANAIASKQKSYDSDSKLNQLVLACLFHDIAYPLSESRTIIEQAFRAMESCYKALTFPQVPYSYMIRKVTNLQKQLQTLPGFETEDFATALDQFAHNIIGGIEFLDYTEDAATFIPVLEAIVFHDSSFRNEVRPELSPFLATLIIADELQDWGRPIPFQEEALIPEIGDLTISENIVSGTLDYRRKSSLSPFRQAMSKLRNLRRLKLDAWKLTVNLRMGLPDYKTIDLCELEQCIMKLLHNASDLPELPSDPGQQVFMERYYGIKVSQETHSKVKAAILQEKLIESSPITRFDTLVNPPRTEFILLDKSIGSMRELILKAEKGDRFHLIVVGDQDAPVELYGVGDNRGRQIAEFLAEELRIFNRLVSAHRLKEENKGFFPQLGEYFLPPDLIRERLGSLCSELKDLAFVDSLRDIRRAMSEDGLFIIDRSSA